MGFSWADALCTMSSSTSLLLACRSCVAPKETIAKVKSLKRAIMMRQPFLGKFNVGSLQ